MRATIALAALGLAGCTLTVPPTTTSSYPPDGYAASGFNHTCAFVNGKAPFCVQGMHPPCVTGVGAGCGIPVALDEGISPFFGTSDARVYFDATTHYFYGVSLLNSALIGALAVSDDTDWRVTQAPSFTLLAPGNAADTPRLGFGDSAILVATNNLDRDVAYCDKDSFIGTLPVCQTLDGTHPDYTVWVPAHSLHGTGGAVYAARVSTDGCKIVLGKGTGVVGRASWVTKEFPLTNCLHNPTVQQPDGTFLELFSAEQGEPSDFVYNETNGQFVGLFLDSCSGVACERMIAFDWGRGTLTNLCAFQLGNNGVFMGAIGVAGTGDIGGVALYGGPQNAVGTVAIGLEGGQCVEHIIAGGNANIAAGALGARVGDFSGCALDPAAPGGRWLWCVGQASQLTNGRQVDQSFLTQVCASYQPPSARFLGYCN